MNNSIRESNGPEGYYVSGIEITYTCKDGYIMSPGDYKGEICEDDGSYSVLTDDKYEKIRGQCIAGKLLN